MVIREGVAEVVSGPDKPTRPIAMYGRRVGWSESASLPDQAASASKHARANAHYLKQLGDEHQKALDQASAAQPPVPQPASDRGLSRPSGAYSDLKGKGQKPEKPTQAPSSEPQAEQGRLAVSRQEAVAAWKAARAAIKSPDQARSQGNPDKSNGRGSGRDGGMGR